MDREEEARRQTKRMSRRLSGAQEEERVEQGVKRRRVGDEGVREELDRITRKYEDLVKKLRDKVIPASTFIATPLPPQVECPVCFDIPRKAPIPVCPNGHVVCVRCVRGECPTCR